MNDYRNWKGECLTVSVGGTPVVWCFDRAGKQHHEVDYVTYDAQGIQPPRGQLDHCKR